VSANTTRRSLQCGCRWRAPAVQRAFRRRGTGSLTAALSFVALLVAIQAPVAPAASTPRPDPYPTRDSGPAATPTPDPAPASTTAPVADAASPTQVSQNVVAATSTASSPTSGAASARPSTTPRDSAPSTKKATRAVSRPVTHSGPQGPHARAAPGPATRPKSASAAPAVASSTAAGDGIRLLPPAIALLALVIASGCLLQLLARTDGGRARV